MRDPEKSAMPCPRLGTLTATAMAAMLVASALVACGGGGGGSTPTEQQPSTVKLSGKVIDGPLQGASACYDINDNNQCDSGEPMSAATGADGSFSIDVPIEQAGRHRVVVEVPASAIDQSTGAAVGTAFSLLAPASGSGGAQSVFVSPLTTLVQLHIDATGATLSAASELIKAQAALAISPLEDFSASNGAAQTQAAHTARVVQLTLLRQGSDLASVVGTADLNGNTITRADLNKALASAMLAALPSAAALVNDPAVSNATPAALQAALQSAAQSLAAQAALTSSTVASQIAVAKATPEGPSTTPSASAVLDYLSFSNADNWYMRTLEGSAADNTPDAKGLLRYYERRLQSSSTGLSSNGVVRGWSQGGIPERKGDLHWNGSNWTACSQLGSRYTTTPRDAQGRSNYDYCDGLEQGAGQRSSVDVSGKSIAAVVKQTIRNYASVPNGPNYANWGPADPDAAFGSATFPNGSKLFLQINTLTGTAPSYDVRSSNLVQVYSAEVAAGGDARGASPACAVAANQVSRPVATLEQLVALNPGQPCVLNQAVNGNDRSLDPNEWWSNSTASLGVLTGAASVPANTGAWYNADLRLRVAFDASGNGTRWYGCLSRASNGSSRNCTLLGAGSWSMQTLGDARVMSFSGLPARAKALGYDRVFIERGGSVYFGARNPVGTVANRLRLNATAGNAVLTTLGLPPLQPTARFTDLDPASQAALTQAKGVFTSADATDALFLRFGDGGRFLMAEATPPDSSTREVSGVELGWMDYRVADGSFNTLLELDTNLSAGTSHPSNAADHTGLVFSASALTKGNLTLPRASSDNAGIVGVWAKGSATELNTQHFVFYPNGRVMMVDPIGNDEPGQCQQANAGPPGVEYGQYTYDAATGSLHVFGKLYNTNGCAGLFDDSDDITLTVTIAPDGQTASAKGVTLYRIMP